MTERERRGLGQSYTWFTGEILKSCRIINDRVDTIALEIMCAEPDTPEGRKAISDECNRVAALCFGELSGKELESTAKTILGEGKPT